MLVSLVLKLKNNPKMGRALLFKRNQTYNKL